MRWLRSETLVVTWFATWNCSGASRLNHINEQDRNIEKTNYARDLSHNLTTTPVENDDSSKEISINYSYEIQLTDGTYDPNEEDLLCLEETVRKSIPILDVEYLPKNITWVGSELHTIGEEEEYSEYEGGGYLEEEEEEVEVSSEEEAEEPHLHVAKPPPDHGTENWGTAIKPPPPDTKETQESSVPGEKTEIKVSQKSPESNPGNNHPTHAPEKRQEESPSLIHADINENSVGEIDVNGMTRKKSKNSDSESDSSSDSDSDSSGSDSSSSHSDSDSSSSDSSSRSRSKRSRSRSKRSRSRSKRRNSRRSGKNSRRSGKNSKSRGRGKRGSRSSNSGNSSSSSGGGGDRDLRARRFLQPGLTKSTLTPAQKLKLKLKRKRNKRKRGRTAGTNPLRANTGRASMMVMGAAYGRCENCNTDDKDQGVIYHSTPEYKVFMQKRLQKAIFSTCPTSEQYMRRGVFTVLESNQEENSNPTVPWE